MDVFIMRKRLNAEVVLLRSKAGTLENVKNLNLWGYDIEDVSLLEEMPNLEVVSLSVNNISTLRSFSGCLKVREIYLRKNLISDISEIDFLVSLPLLSVLWLSDNPIAEIPNYRASVIQKLPNLTKLDNIEIDPEERRNMPKVKREPLIEREHKPYQDNPLPNPKPAPKEPPRQEINEDNRRSDNVLTAIISLIRELNQSSLELLEREVQRQIRK